LKRQYNLDNSDNDQKNFTFGSENLEKKKERYIRLPKDHETPVGEFRLNNSKYFSIIYDIFKEFHGSPVIRTASERIFSHCENQVWDGRNRINPEQFGKVMFIYENEDVYNKYKLNFQIKSSISYLLNYLVIAKLKSLKL
jgi:hypothetical protein